jgi:hypothetical protein
VDDGPPVPPELDDLLPPPAADPPENRPAARGGKKTSADRHPEAGVRGGAPSGGVAAPPPWDYGPVPSPSATPAPAPASARPGTRDTEQVAAPVQSALPTVTEARRQLTAANARNSLSAMAVTLVFGVAWALVSASRRRAGRY